MIILSKCLTIFTSHQRLKHVVSGIVQMSLIHCQTGGIDHLLREPVPVLHYFYGQEILPNVKPDPFPVQF